MSDRLEPIVTRPTTGKHGRAIRRFRVNVISGPANGTSWAEPLERCTIGSHPSNDLIVDDPTVSRFHCELTVAGDRVRLRDLGSRNGTQAHGIALGDAMIGGGTVLALGHTDV